MFNYNNWFPIQPVWGEQRAVMFYSHCIDIVWVFWEWNFQQFLFYVSFLKGFCLFVHLISFLKIDTSSNDLRTVATTCWKVTTVANITIMWSVHSCHGTKSMSDTCTSSRTFFSNCLHDSCSKPQDCHIPLIISRQLHHSIYMYCVYHICIFHDLLSRPTLSHNTWRSVAALCLLEHNALLCTVKVKDIADWFPCRHHPVEERGSVKDILIIY